MLETLGARRAVGKADADDVLWAERLCGEKCGDGGVDATGDADDRILEAATLELLAQEVDEPFLDERGVDVERCRTGVVGGRRADDRHRRAAAVSGGRVSATRGGGTV